MGSGGRAGAAEGAEGCAVGLWMRGGETAWRLGRGATPHGGWVGMGGPGAQGPSTAVWLSLNWLRVGTSLGRSLAGSTLPWAFRLRETPPCPTSPSSAPVPFCSRTGTPRGTSGNELWQQEMG